MTLSLASEYMDQIKNELDLNEETFISDTEMLGYLKSAVNRAEQLILGIYEDYFLESADVATTLGSAALTLPANIYAHKIRTMYYANGSDIYEVKRLKNLREIPEVDVNEDYRYIVKNTLAGGASIQLIPVARETSSSNITCWFIRNATTITAATDTVDIPEAQNFILAFLRYKCMAKEGHPLMADAKEALVKEEQLLVDTLTSMVPDEDNQIQIDTSFYDDFSGVGV
jgi:hypothetical protein